MSLELKIGAIEGTLESNGWRISPQNKMEVRRVAIIRFQHTIPCHTYTGVQEGFSLL